MSPGLVRSLSDPSKELSTDLSTPSFIFSWIPAVASVDRSVVDEVPNLWKVTALLCSSLLLGQTVVYVAASDFCGD